MSYKCDCCGKTKHIAFTCKSRFCNSCGKPLSDLWTNNLMTRRPKYLKYYHLAFTIPERLRNFFKRHRKALNELPRTANQAMSYFFRKKYKCTPWLLSVIHTFWAKTNWNPHIHVMVTSWWITKEKLYKSIEFLPYLGVISSRQTHLIWNLKKWCDKNLIGQEHQDEKRFLNTFFKEKDIDGDEKSRYVYFSKKANNFETVLSYIGRYLKRPIIAQSRILAYDGKNVTYSYKDKYDNTVKEMTVTAMEFIGNLIQHIPNKFFKMINYAWMFANRCKEKHLKIINTYYNTTSKMPKIGKNFRERIFLFTGKDPLLCSCWWYFYKYQIIIPGYRPKYFDSS